MMSLSYEARVKAKEKAFSFLHEEYEFMNWTAEGRFSTIKVFRKPVDRSLIAAKVVAAEDTWPGEMEKWPNFHHENLVPLLDIARIEGCNVFFTPVYPNSLHAILRRSSFCCAPDVFQRTKKWIGDVATGLFYLHKIEVCHLNLQLSNIFIRMDQKAVIADFGCIDTTKRPVNSYGLPRQYSPPECWSGPVKEDRPRILGIPYDVWSLGMTALNIWADRSLQHKTNSFYPHIFEALDFENFQRNFTTAFPNANVEEEDLRIALNFMRGLLHTDPFQRPNSTKVLEHALLSGGNWTSWFITHPRWMDEETAYMIKQSGDESKNDNTYEPTAEQLNIIKVSMKNVKRSDRKNGVRGWFRKKWRKFKAFFCCNTSSE